MKTAHGITAAQKVVQNLILNYCCDAAVVQIDWTFNMIYKIANNFHYGFLKLSCTNNFLSFSKFIKMLESFIKQVSEFLSREVLQVLLGASSIFEYSKNFIRSTAILMESNISHSVYNFRTSVILSVLLEERWCFYNFRISIKRGVSKLFWYGGTAVSMSKVSKSSFVRRFEAVPIFQLCFRQQVYFIWN